MAEKWSTKIKMSLKYLNESYTSYTVTRKGKVNICRGYLQIKSWICTKKVYKHVLG